MVMEDGVHTDEYGVALGARIRAVRKQKRLSLQDVEALSDQEFKASVLGAYERGQRRIAVPRLQRLAQLYRVPVDQLLPDASKVEDKDHRGWERGTDRAIIDLSKLDTVSGPERDVVERYARSIEVQRQDFNGRMLTMRSDDLRLIAALFERTPASMVERLEHLGLLVREPS
jgi:transcriptional regulator with XRE-family HTH domain